MGTPTRSAPEKELPSPPTAPVPAADTRLHSHLARRHDPRFRMFLILAVILLLIAAVFLWR